MFKVTAILGFLGQSPLEKITGAVLNLKTNILKSALLKNCAKIYYKPKLNLGRKEKNFYLKHLILGKNTYALNYYTNYFLLLLKQTSLV